MQLKQIKDKNLNVPDEFKNLYKVVDKLEKRIATLEKVLESHAKCIGAIRKICDEWFKILPRTWLSYLSNTGQAQRTKGKQDLSN